ncbi:MAG: hypothetical protein ACRDLM_08550 [Gaiellaceae bacterium]
MALIAMLVLAGAAFAKSHPQTSLVPRLDPRPQAWLMLLKQYPRDPKPLHQQKAQRLTHVARRPPRPKQGTTLSMYERTARPWVLQQQGCSAARRHASGVVILDFGKPAYKRHSYGTILFSGRFASNHRITIALVGWAHGYVHCLPRGSSAFVSLARGTSNYHPAVPSAYAAGRHWAGQTIKLQRKLHRENLDWHVTAAAADDAEPAWDRHFRKTREFVHGFRVAAGGHTLYDYGSLDGGVGSIWSARQAFYVAGGIRHTAALPEIYNRAQAREWAELAGIARSRYHSLVHFAGVMTQGSPHCHCSLRPHEAHRALVRALASYGVHQTPLPRGGTNIR